MPIQQLIPIALRLEFAGQYDGGLINSKFLFKPLRCKIEENEVITVFEFVSKVTCLESDFELDFSVRIPFIISSKKHIDFDDCFEIITLGIEYLKKASNIAIYPSEASIEIPIPSLDVLKTTTMAFLEETNAKGFYKLK